MINKKLLSFDRAALRYVGANVAFQWLGLVCNIIFVRAVARLVGAAFAGSLTAAAPCFCSLRGRPGVTFPPPVLHWTEGEGASPCWSTWR